MKHTTLLPIGLAALCALAGCVPPPVVAYPGQGKSFASFQQDDMACHQQAAQTPMPPPKPAPGEALHTPALVYSQCMVSHGNRIGPPPAPPPVVMVGPYYPPGGGIYAGFGDTYPWEYGY